ncbi:hypothetical protein BH23ACT5_BH23ACT5_08210 [soil metagenome]
MKCEHIICTCVVAESMDVCSVHCREAVEGDEETGVAHSVCECGHPECEVDTDAPEVELDADLFVAGESRSD